MSSKKYFEQGLVYNVTNYIYWLFLCNFYFLLCNILFIFVFFTTDTKLENLLIYTISLIPFGPAATALCASMGKIARDKDINPTSYFFKSYKDNFWQSIKLWSVELFVLFILAVDMQYFSINSSLSLFIPLLLGLAIFVLIIGLYIFPILSRFSMRSRDILKISIYYLYRKIHITILNACVVVASLFLMEKLSSYYLLFSASLSCFLIMLNLKPVLTEMEERFTESQEPLRPL